MDRNNICQKLEILQQQIQHQMEIQKFYNKQLYDMVINHFDKVEEKQNMILEQFNEIKQVFQQHIQHNEPNQKYKHFINNQKKIVIQISYMTLLTNMKNSEIIQNKKTIAFGIKDIIISELNKNGIYYTRRDFYIEPFYNQQFDTYYVELESNKQTNIDTIYEYINNYENQNKIISLLQDKYKSMKIPHELNVSLKQ